MFSCGRARDGVPDFGAGRTDSGAAACAGCAGAGGNAFNACAVLMAGEGAGCSPEVCEPDTIEDSAVTSLRRPEWSTWFVEKDDGGAALGNPRGSYLVFRRSLLDARIGM